MNIYLFQALNGLGIGMIYFLLSVGLSITFGLLGFVNFAHGALFLVGAYASISATQASGSFVFGLVAAFSTTAAIGVLAEKLMLRRAYRLPHETQILITLGLTFVITETVILIFGPQAQNVGIPEVFDGVIPLGPYPIPLYRVFIFVTCAFVGLGLWLVFERTLFGAKVRAASEAPEMLTLLGIPVSRLYAVSFGLGAGLAGLAGGLTAPLRGADPSMGADAIVIAFVVVVLGGMGSFSGPLVGGLIVGLTQSLVSALWPEGARLAIFLVMAAILLIMPKGLFGRA